MKTVFEHIEHIKGKPHHIRKQIGFTMAASGAAFIGAIWFGASWYTGAFAIHNTSFADAGQSGTLTTEANDGSTAFAGAAAAIPNQTPARIQIIDAASSTNTKKPVEKTTISF